MTEWVELPPGTCGIVEFDFDGDPDQYQLKLFREDVVTLLSKTSDGHWYKGFKIEPNKKLHPMFKTSNVKGVFPVSYITKTSIKTIVSKKKPTVSLY